MINLWKSRRRWFSLAAVCVLVSDLAIKYIESVLPEAVPERFLARCVFDAGIFIILLQRCLCV